MPTIIPADDADSKRLAVALLEAAGDRPERVRTVSAGPRLAFEVDDDLAAAIGTEQYMPEPEPDPAKPAPKKAAPRKTSVKAAAAG
ncbi:hypothetical protein [Gordonia sp. (in: high G+C Gram-positive bacteria)]|uniref:hypothetical protein n=1 Tax=Gordonia sp. (in: high G+C Gram-positive bacteria) TaxID=84139 RepID=UPI002613DACE|nr:hypothetical protein [Gordonia sp. (in: high G+C Gram-positive bacteria)]